MQRFMQNGDQDRPLLPPRLRLGFRERDILLNIQGFELEPTGWGTFFDTGECSPSERESYRRAFRTLRGAGLVQFGYGWTTSDGPGRGRGHRRDDDGQHVCSRRHYRLTPLGQLIVNIVRAELESGTPIRWAPVRAHIDTLSEKSRAFIAKSSRLPQGVSMPQIAKEEGVSVSTIYRHLQKHQEV